MPTVTRQVAEIRADLDENAKAISAARAGSSYSIGGRTVTRQDLETLYVDRTHLLRELQTAQSIQQGATSPGVAVATWHR